MGDYDTGMTRLYIDAPLDAPRNTPDGKGVRDFLGQHWKLFRDNHISPFARHTMHEWLDTHPDNGGEGSDPHAYAQDMVLDFLSGDDDYLDGVLMLTDREEESAGMQDERDYGRAHVPVRNFPYFTTADEELDVHDDVAEINEVLDEFDEGDDWTRLYFAGPVSIDPEGAKENKRAFLQEHYETLRDRQINVHSPHETYTWIDEVEEHAGKGSPPELYVMTMCVDFVGPAFDGVDAVLHLTAEDEETERMAEITEHARDNDVPVYYHPVYTQDGTPLTEHIITGIADD